MGDLCYSWPQLNRVLQQADTMDRMIEHTRASRGVALRRENGNAWYEARSRCIECPHDRRCRSWMAAQPDGDVPSFCPNAEFLRACKVT
jgi:hypothetical protein